MRSNDLKTVVPIVGIVSLCLAIFQGRQLVEARRVEDKGRELLAAIKTGKVCEMASVDQHGVVDFDTLTPEKIEQWEQRIDELKWLGDDAFESHREFYWEVGFLMIEVSPARKVEIRLVDSRERAWERLPTPDSFQGAYVAYTKDRGFMLR